MKDKLSKATEQLDKYNKEKQGLIKVLESLKGDAKLLKEQLIALKEQYDNTVETILRIENNFSDEMVKTELNVEKSKNTAEESEESLPKKKTAQKTVLEESSKESLTEENQDEVEELLETEEEFQTEYEEFEDGGFDELDLDSEDIFGDGLNEATDIDNINF